MEYAKTEELISLVQKYEHLYNAQRADYKDSLKKENSWSEIADVMGDNFSRELRKKKQKSGSGRMIQSKWRFFEQMGFMNDFIRPRKRLENTTNLAHNGTEIDGSEYSDENNLSKENEEENTQLPSASKHEAGDHESSDKKRSRNHGRYLDELIIKELEKPMEDKYDHFGKYVASELRSIGDPSIEYKMMTAIHEIFLRSKTQNLVPDDAINEDIFQVNFSNMFND